MRRQTYMVFGAVELCKLFIKPMIEKRSGSIPPSGAAADTLAQLRVAHAFAIRGELARMPHIPVSLLDMYGGKLSFGIPAVQVRPLYTQQEMWQYNVSQGTEVRIPAFKVMF